MDVYFTLIYYIGTGMLAVNKIDNAIVSKSNNIKTILMYFNGFSVLTKIKKKLYSRSH